MRSNFPLYELYKLSIEAGKAIMQVYETAFEVDYKSDHSPLTLADKRSNDVITEGLKKISEFPILSEETKQAPYMERKDWKRFWLVDPLDGTKGFVKRNGEFTVNIALIEDSRPILGIIYVPVTKALYFALKGEGSFLYHWSVVSGQSSVHNVLPDSLDELMRESKKLPFVSKSSDELIIVASRSHLSAKTEVFIQQSESGNQYSKVSTVSAGSSLKFCLVAEGKADVYPRFAPTMEWDTAAGQIICEESGKKVLNYDTQQPLTYNKPDLLNPDFIVL